MSPRVSIVIRTRNRADMLSEAVTSALGQDYPNLEVIVSDDASSDHTVEVIQSFAQDPRLKYFRNLVRLNLSAHLRKACFEYASGDWVLILDDDDYLLDPTYVSKAMNLAGTDSDIVIVHSNCKILINDTGRLTNTDKALPSVVDGKWMFINYKYAYYGNVNCDTLTVIFNRHAAMAVNCFSDDRITFGEDREAFLKLALNGKVGFLNDVSAVYRVHGNNLHRWVDVDNFFASLRSILNPYELAKLSRCFDISTLERWKRRMIRELCEIWLVASLTTCRHKIAFLAKFVMRLCSEYPTALLCIFKVLRPKTLVKIALSSVNNLSGAPEASDRMRSDDQLARSRVIIP